MDFDGVGPRKGLWVDGFQIYASDSWNREAVYARGQVKENIEYRTRNVEFRSEESLRSII